MREGAGGDRPYHRAPPCPRTDALAWTESQQTGRSPGRANCKGTDFSTNLPVPTVVPSHREALGVRVRRAVGSPAAFSASLRHRHSDRRSSRRHACTPYLCLAERQEEMVRGGEGSDRRLVFGSSHRREGGRGRNGGSHLSLPLAHPISFGLLYSSRGVET